MSTPLDSLSTTPENWGNSKCARLFSQCVEKNYHFDPLKKKKNLTLFLVSTILILQPIKKSWLTTTVQKRFATNGEDLQRGRVAKRAAASGQGFQVSEGSGENKE